MASSAFVGVAELGIELFHLGVTDIVIAVYALAGSLAVNYRRPVLAGILFGLALASKSLPGGFLAVLMVIWFTGRPGARCFTIALAATALGIVVPFVLWNPPAFLSATVLFYATFHSAGDDTALWFFLPSPLRLPFLALGGGHLFSPSLSLRGSIVAGSSPSLCSRPFWPLWPSWLSAG